MTKEELIHILSEKDVDYVMDRLTQDGIDCDERDFMFVLEDIMEKYFKSETL